MKLIETVNGPISPNELGITLTHEHILINGLSWKVNPIEQHQIELTRKTKHKIELPILNALRRGPHFSEYNLILDDPILMTEELMHYRRAGGNAIVDLTVEGMEGMPRNKFIKKVKKISNKVNLHLLVSTGYYLAPTHPDYVSSKNSSDLREKMTRDILKGIGDTGVKASVIGEIGVSTGNMTKDEEKVLRAACQTQLHTDAPLVIHTWGETKEKMQISKVLCILEEEEVKPNKVLLSHIEFSRNIDCIKEVAKQGFYLGIDCFGAEFPMMFDTHNIVTPTDYERAFYIKELIDRGYLHQILISHDIALKIDLKKFGGWGYDHLLVNIPKIFKKACLTIQDYYTIIKENPKNFFAF